MQMNLNATCNQKLIGAVGLTAILTIVATLFVTRDRSGDEPPDRDTPVTINGTRYLAIGDSYAAGEGVTPFEKGATDKTGDRCHRSMLGYAHRLTFTEPRPTLDNRACTGAVIANLTTTTQKHGGVPNHFGLQLGDVETAALGKDLGLVTISIGGNDAGFANVLRFCGETKQCVDKPYLNGLTLRQWATQVLPTIVDRARLIYRQDKKGAPNARILVLGYPHLFPDGKPEGGTTCQAIAAAYDLAERNFVRTTSSLLNTSLEAAAVSEGVDFIETKWMFAGHEACGRNADWINAFRLTNLGASFHPNKTGQLAYKDLITCYLQLHSAAAGSVGGSLGDDDLLSCARGIPQ
jgi:lysophospholipase L1-like esterase